MAERKGAGLSNRVALLDTEYYRARLAIERLYAVFAAYPAPRSLAVSPLKDGEGMFLMLKGRPLSALSADDLGAYAWSALFTAGDDRDYRHFLPRILDLALKLNGQPGLSPAVIAGKLDYCGWRAWPQNEIECVEEFFICAWTFALSSPPNFADATEWLVGMARGRMDVGAALKAWELAKSQWASLHLSEFVLGLPKRFHRTGLPCGAYWDEVDRDILEEIGFWLRSPSLEDRLFQAAIERSWPNDHYPERLAAAADCLQALRNKPIG